MKRCPNCSRQFLDSDSFCPFCGIRLTQNDPSSEQQTVYRPDQTPSSSDEDIKTGIYFENADPYGNVSDPYANAPNPYANNPNPYGNAANPYDTAPKPYESAVNPYGDRPEPYGVPQNPAPFAPSPEPPKKKSNDTAIILIVVIAVVVVIAGVAAGIAISANNRRNRNPYDDSYLPVETTTAQAVEVIIPETTTAAPPATTAAPATQNTVAAMNEADVKETAYLTFRNFYNSYLDGINQLDITMIDYCTDSVRYEMQDRFELNRKSVFDLLRFDFDESSFSVSGTGSSQKCVFYVKCVTQMYERNTYSDKGLNYATWKVTVIPRNGRYVVSGMERDEKHQMSSNVKTVTDSYSIF